VENQARDFLIIFTSILYEALPFIILGAVISGMLEELVPQQFISKVLPRSRILAIAVGGLLGIVFPMCECGIIPVMRRLLRKGLPLSSCICYMLAGPIINVVVMLSTWFAFSGMENTTKAGGPAQLGSFGMTFLRMVLGYLVAFGTSLIVEWQYRKHGNKLLAPLAVPPPQPDSDEPRPAEKKPWMLRISNMAEAALHDFVDITVFLILGALLAAATRLVIDRDQLEQIGAVFPLAILLMMGLAIALCLCSEADAFVAASFGTMPPSAKIGFLVLGPMLDFKLYMMFTRVFKPKLIWIIIPSVIVQTYIYSLLTHLLLENVPAVRQFLTQSFSFGGS
jgi:uncharacterized membrane protein YraQ (UPF0718 family)